MVQIADICNRLLGATPQGFQMKITLANLNGGEHNLVEEAVGKTKISKVWRGENTNFLSLRIFFFLLTDHFLIVIY